jgi:RNA-binding protein
LTLTARARAALRAEAHHLTATVHVGQAGVTPTVVQALDDALRTRELVKVQVGRQATVSVREMAAALASAALADVVQVIGRTTTLYRRNPELAGRPGDPPPWRR